MGLEELGDLVLYEIVSKLSSKDLALVSCVNKRLNNSASDESLWSIICFEDLDLSTPQDPFGNPISSFKETYQLWREMFYMYPWSLVKRVKRCWGSLRSWTTVHFPEVGKTMQDGASEDDIKKLEDSLGVKLPLSTRVLYRLCDGQGDRNKGEKSKDDTECELSCALGLIGGYSFYDHVVNVYLLPLSEVITATKEFVRRLGFSNRSKFIIIAASTTYSEKMFFLNCISGQIYVGTRNLSTDGEMMPCVPSALLTSVHDFNSAEQQDGMLLWLEEHSRRLHTGIVSVREDGPFRSINLFPRAPPLSSTAVTHGVQVCASAVLVPELSDLQNEFEKYWFSYSIRMRLLREGCESNGMIFTSCQLFRRHWVIRANDVVVSDVDAEAVIGKFPLLKQDDDEEFVYESCTPLTATAGSVEGAFTFVPGRFSSDMNRLTNPIGNSFEVEVAKFPLQLPEYIF